MTEDDLKTISIETAHMMDQKSQSHKRPINFSSQEDKIKVLKHAKNCQDSKKYAVSNHLPPELNERKRQLWSKFKDAKEQNCKVKWIGEKLLLDDQIVQAKKDIMCSDVADVEETNFKTRFTPPKMSRIVSSKATSQMSHMKMKLDQSYKYFIWILT